MTQSGASPTVLIVEDNLFFHAKLEGLLKRAGYNTVVASTQAKFDQALDSSPAVILVSVACRSLPWTEWVQRARQQLGAEFPIVGYGGHVNEAGFAAGQTAGCSTVVSNGQISAQAAEIVAQLVARG